MQSFEDFTAECDLGARLHSLAAFFNETAAGRAGIPSRKPIVDSRLLPNDTLLHRFIDLHARRQGHFDQHYHASIPYRLEEECRMGHALMRYSQLKVSDLAFYSLGTAEGTMARTLSELSDGKIQSLSCSPTRENRDCFMAFGEPPHASFFLGPFHHLTRDRLQSDPTLQRFSEGFDVIFEDTTFQMYSANRSTQIEFVRQNLKDDGILLLLEKFRSADEPDYQRRECQKNCGFKVRFFRTEDIKRKEEEVLATMYKGEVTLSEMARAVYACFEHCVVTWNSGNFYGLAASNSEQNLQRYCSNMVSPAIPTEYIYWPEAYTSLKSWLLR